MESPLARELAFRWSLTVGCCALLLFFFSPPWGAFQLWGRVPEMGGMLEVRRGAAVWFQVEHLGAPIPDPLHGAIQWRLLFPAMGRALQLPAPILFGLAPLGCLLGLAFIVTVLRRNGLGWSACAAAALMLGATSWFFTSVSWLGYYDSWLVLGLLLVAFADSRWAAWFACAWAPWVDERFVLAAPLALLCRHLYLEHREQVAGGKQVFAVASILVLGFVAVRLAVLGRHSAGSATVSGYLAQFGGMDAAFSRLLFGAWSGLRVAWVLVGLAVLLLWSKRRRNDALVLAAVVMLVIGVGLATAQDFSRSMMLVFPAAVLGAVKSGTVKAQWNTFALGAAAAALVLPAHHVMNDRVNPIYYFYHELAAIDRPPLEARAEWHELRGIHAMQDGDFATAAEALSLAIKLAPNPAGPSKQRGVLFASQQKWAEARKDFSTMVEHEPKNPDGWFLRAQAALALGDARAAEADWQRAVAVAPTAWRERPDVTRFETRLRAAQR